MDMLKDLETFNEEVEKEGIPAFGMGLGINTATVVVGNMGSDQRFDYTCLGDGVNLAARLEGQSKPYGVKLVVGPLTAELVRDVYQVVELDLIAVKGKTEPARIFTITREFDALGEQQHIKFLDLYRQGQWIVAAKFAQELKQCWNGELDAYYDMMIERCADMKKANIKNFDGIYRATSK
jgi:adenylate cyclase